MADIAVSFEASELFGLNSNFKPQRSTTTVTRERAINLSNIGDVACESDAFNVTTNYTGEYEYCGSAFILSLIHI